MLATTTVRLLTTILEEEEVKGVSVLLTDAEAIEATTFEDVVEEDFSYPELRLRVVSDC